MAIDAVIFDLDGVLVDSAPLWDDVRCRFAVAHGGRWRADAQRWMMGMSSREWARFMRTDLLALAHVRRRRARGVAGHAAAVPASGRARVVVRNRVGRLDQVGEP